MGLWLMVLGACGDEPRVRPWPSGPGADTALGVETGDTGDTGDTGTAAGPLAPELYDDDRVHSPLTAFAAARLQEVAASGSGQPDVFMKIGASSTVSTSTLYCFAGDDVDLDVYADVLEDTWLWFLDGDAAGSSPYDRDTEAAVSGKTAAWAIDGDPSPVDAEIAAIAPGLAVVHYGTNDMGMGTTYESAMPGFYDAMATLLDDLVDQGIVPIVTGISHRGDRAAADLWVETYNAVLRGLAQVRQVPFIDLHLAMDPLDGHGLSSDGLHLEGWSEGPCLLTPEGLEHGYNTRNLIVLQALDRMVQVLDDDVSAVDPSVATLAGRGSPAQPYRVPGLPFAHGADTSASPHRDLSLYSGCDSDADEGGPELTYRFSLARETALRALVLDQGDTDVDLHLLHVGGTEGDCLARAHRTLEGTLAAGEYALVVDSWVDDGGDERSGEYLLVLQACEDGDQDCAAQLD